jgi:hypothetical protein
MEFLQPNKVLLDAPSAHKSIKDTNTPSFIIRPTAASTPKRLLSHHRTSTFVVVVYVTSRVTQFVGGRQECVTVGSETKLKIQFFFGKHGMRIITNLK